MSGTKSMKSSKSTKSTKSTKISEPLNFVSIGCDLGNDKITISRMPSDIDSPTVIADMMDIRNIPNRVMFLKEIDQVRNFGNNTTLNKSWDPLTNSLAPISIGPVPSLLRTSDLLIGGQTIEKVPGFIVKNMIQGHVKQIVDSRYPDDKKQLYVIVPSWDESSTNILFDTLGARTILMNENNEINIETLSDIDATIMNYVGKHISKENDVPKKTVLVIDIGHKKTNFVLFSVSKDKTGTVIQQLMTIIEKEICGNVVNDLLVKYMGTLAKEKYNYDPNKSNDSRLKFRAQCIRLKHQMSLNNKINFTFETPERDMAFEISRADFEHEMKVVLMLLKKNIQIINEAFNCPDVVESIGGSGRMPLFKTTIEQLYPNVQRTMNPDETVSCGAAFYGQLIVNGGNIKYGKIVQKNVDIEYVKNNIIQSVRVFEKFQQIDPLNSSVSVTRIAKSENFQIVVQDLKIQCEIMSPCHDGEFMDIELNYNMTDLVDVINIKDVKTGEIIEFQLYVNSHEIDVNELVKNYSPVENIIKAMESQNLIHGSVINFIEEYYYDSDGVNRMIQNINNIYGLNDIQDVGSNRKGKVLEYPLKEVCEFYDFCTFYTKVPETDIEQQYHDCIVRVLDNPDGLNGIINAIDTIKIIKTKYGTLK